MQWIFFLLLSVNCAFASLTKIQSPTTYEKKLSDPPSIFLAGSAYYPWREKLIKLLEKEDLIVFHPINDELHQKSQRSRILWEHTHMDNSDISVVWIPKGKTSKPRSLSMTSLFECGRFTQMHDKPLIVGIESGYVLKKELELQLRMLRPDIVIADSLQGLSKEIIQKSNEIKKATLIGSVMRTEEDSNL